MDERQLSVWKKNDDKTENEIEKRIPDGHGLVRFCLFSPVNARTGYHENAHGAVFGLKSATDTIDIVQAALESVAFRFAEIYDQLNKVSEHKRNHRQRRRTTRIARLDADYY